MACIRCLWVITLAFSLFCLSNSISWLRVFTVLVTRFRFCHNRKPENCSFLCCCQLSFQCQTDVNGKRQWYRFQFLVVGLLVAKMMSEFDNDPLQEDPAPNTDILLLGDRIHLMPLAQECSYSSVWWLPSREVTFYTVPAKTWHHHSSSRPPSLPAPWTGGSSNP